MLPAIETTNHFFSSPGTVFLDFGFISIRWYGLFTALAFITCMLVAQLIVNKRKLNISHDDVANYAMAIIISGLVGARLWFVILNYEYFLQNPLESFQIWLGGQSIQGGIAGAALGSYLYSIFSKQSFEKYLEMLSLAAIVSPLGQAIGRWGNFFNEEAFGKVTDLPWALYISHTGELHHPTFLYESIYNLIIFGFLLSSMHKLKSSQIIASYILLYSFGRLLIEPIRTDSLYIGDFKAATLISLLGIAVGSFILSKTFYKAK